MKTLFYYGTEKNRESSMGLMYTAGVYSKTLQENENEAAVRKEIEDRCLNNPYMGLEALHPTLKGMPSPKFQWLN